MLLAEKLTSNPMNFPMGYNLNGRINSALDSGRNGGTMLALALANVDSLQTAINKLRGLANQS